MDLIRCVFGSKKSTVRVFIADYGESDVWRSQSDGCVDSYWLYVGVDSSRYFAWIAYQQISSGEDGSLNVTRFLLLKAYVDGSLAGVARDLVQAQ